MGSGLRALQELAVRNSPTAVPASPPAAASPTRLRPFTPNRPYDGLNRLATLAAKAGGFEGVEVLQMLAQRSLASRVKARQGFDDVVLCMMGMGLGAFDLVWGWHKAFRVGV